jgi:hypothetical protein
MHNPKLAAMQRQNTVARLLGKEEPARPAPPDSGGQQEKPAEKAEKSDVVRRSYCILRGRIEPLSKLRLINRQGEAALVDYGAITWVNLRPDGALVLRVTDGEPYTVTISGQGLAGELLDGLQDEKVEWICELEGLAAAAATRADPAEGVVTGIYIKEGSVSREWSRGAGPSRQGTPHP